MTKSTVNLPIKKYAFAALVGLAFCGVFCNGCTKRSADAVPGKVAGTISVGPELASKVKPTDVLYIIARSQQIGPPAAVKRILSPKFPLHYVIGPEDAMIPGTPGFESDGNLTIAARLSRSGNALAAAGDLEGIYPKNPAHPGDGGIDVVIDREHQN